VVSSAAQSVLGSVTTEAFWADVVGDMVARFWEQTKWCSHLEDLGSRGFDMILGPADNRVQPTIRLEEATRRLHVMHDDHWEAVIELRALWSSVVWVQDLVLEGSHEVSSLVPSLSSAVDLIDGHVDGAAANRVSWGARLALIAALSHFPELESELELFGSKCNTDLTKSQLNAL
jgi:hypothetical protein